MSSLKSNYALYGGIAISLCMHRKDVCSIYKTFLSPESPSCSGLHLPHLSPSFSPSLSRPLFLDLPPLSLTPYASISTLYKALGMWVVNYINGCDRVHWNFPPETPIFRFDSGMSPFADTLHSGCGVNIMVDQGSLPTSIQQGSGCPLPKCSMVSMCIRAWSNWILYWHHSKHQLSAHGHVGLIWRNPCQHVGRQLSSNIAIMCAWAHG